MANLLQKTLIAAVMSLSAVPAAQATVILGNFSGNNLVLGNGISMPNAKAVGLTTGSTDLQFDSMQAYLTYNGGVPQNLIGGIYANNAGSPGSLLAAFAPLTIAPKTVSLFTFTANYTLSANTSYWFSLTSTSAVWNAYSPASLLTVASGITSLGYKVSGNNGVSWSNNGTSNAVQINATEITSNANVPEPETMWLLMPAVAGLWMANRRKA